MEVSTEQLKALFNQDIIDLYKRMIKLVKHKPTRLMDYINKYGGYEAAVKYISTESNVQDFAVLWEKERLDLSVEALITRQPYRVLFDDSILKFCDKKLKEYSYAPNKIKEEPKSTGYIEEEEEKIDLAKLLQDKERYLQEAKKKEYVLYHQNIPISKEDWKALLMNTKVVTANNLDLLLRIYAIGDEVGPKELSQEQGYSSTYPYKEVVTALGKRIKSKLQIEVPVSQSGKSMFWHILFNGGIKDNTAFEWSLKNNLRQAITELIQEGEVKEVTVHNTKQLKTIEEAHIEPIIKKEEQSTAFDKLFEAIMTPNSNEVEKEDMKNQTQESTLAVEPIKEQTEVQAKSPDTQEVKSISSNQEDLSQLDYKERIKKECIEYYGAICDLCGFDFGYTYGEQYENYIEVYNIHGVEGEITETTNPKEDLIPVCCNCYRVIHSQKPPISVEKMRKMIKV